MIVTSWSRGFTVSEPNAYDGSWPRGQGNCVAVGPSGATSEGVFPLPMSDVKVTDTVPSLGSSGFARLKPCVVALAAMAPASVAKLTTVGMPTRLP